MLMSWKLPESVGGMHFLPRAEVGRQEEVGVNSSVYLQSYCWLALTKLREMPCIAAVRLCAEYFLESFILLSFCPSAPLIWPWAHFSR